MTRQLGWRMRGLWVLALLGVYASQVSAQSTPGQGDLTARGREILAKMAQVNHDWLLAPPAEVKAYEYEFRLRDGAWQKIRYQNGGPGQSSSKRQGITYATAIHELARHPEKFTFKRVEEKGGSIELEFANPTGMRGAFGNGIENSWYGYAGFGGNEGTLRLDGARMTPQSLEVGTETETYGEFAPSGPGRYVPLSIRIDKGDMHFKWAFRLYKPGLWLLDVSHYAVQDKAAATLPIVAEVRNVKINDSATAAALAAEARDTAEAGRKFLAGEIMAKRLVEANRAWLKPSLEPRRGLIYDYRQEAPYHERIIFDGQGNLMAQLLATKESPSTPTQQSAFLADGTSVYAQASERYVRESKAAPSDSAQSLPATRLAIGLFWENALTALARNPESFRAETGEARDGKTTITLIPRGRARLFAGTMLAFTSWAYMHDVSYDRAKVLCDAQTMRPLEERDYAGDKLVGQFTFSDYLDDPAGAAPGRIQGLIPYEKDGKDQALEMDATFRFLKPGVWLLQRVHSEFHGGTGGSTGEVTLPPPTPSNLKPLEELQERVKATREEKSALQAAPAGEVTIPFEPAKPVSCWVRVKGPASFAFDRSRDRKGDEKLLIGAKDIKIEAGPGGGWQATLNVLSNTVGYGYTIDATVELLDEQGKVVSSGASGPQTLEVLSALKAFPITVKLDQKTPAAPIRQVRVRLPEAKAAWGMMGGSDVFRVKP